MANFISIESRPESGRILGPVPLINIGEISGSATSDLVALAAAQIEEFAAEGGRAHPIVYGRHVIAGILLVHKFTLGSPNTSIIYVALGEGQGAGGGHGEWNALVALYYNGATQSVSGSGTAPGYRFYPGFISTGVASGPQQVDAFLPDNLAYSGTAYYAIKLTDAVANAEDRPDKLRAVAEGRKTLNFNHSGISLGSIYSVNPAHVAADRILAYYEHKFPNDPALALRELQEMIEWNSWTAWRDFNGALIPWNNGVSVVNIPRFEFHGAFTGDVKLDEALDVICASAGAHWQIDGEQIIFLPPSERDPFHHFDESNIIAGSVRIEDRDLRTRPNIFEATHRDTLDTFLGLTSTKPLRREALIKQAGEIKSTQALTGMGQSQAERLIARRARIEADIDVVVALIGDEASIHVLPGDFVTVSHPMGPWSYQRFLVDEVTLESAEDGPDICEFVLLKVDEPLYSDTDHSPQQPKLQSLQPQSNTSPDSAQGGAAVTGPVNNGHGSTNVAAIDGGNQTKSCLWTTFPAITGTKLSVVLKVGWTENGSLVANGTSGFRLQYSIDGGSNWTDIFDHLNVTSSTSSSSSVTLSTSQDLTLVRVRDRLTVNTVGGGDSASLTASISDIHIDVEFI